MVQPSATQAWEKCLNTQDHFQERNMIQKIKRNIIPLITMVVGFGVCHLTALGVTQQLIHFELVLSEILFAIIGFMVGLMGTASLRK